MGRRTVGRSRRRTSGAIEPSGRGDVPLISPRARTLLTTLGFSLDHAREITGSGPGGRIVDRDVTAWAEARSGQAQVSPSATGGLTVARTIPLRGRRGTIASRMVSSLQTAAQLTSVLELDVKPLVELRAQTQRGGGVAAHRDHFDRRQARRGRAA